MSIEEITLRNFRSWRDEHRIPLRPLTLIYGPNSSGKSSILIALSLLRQTLERASGAPVPLHPVGPYADVGDFSTLVHGHEKERALGIGLSYRVSGATHRLLRGSLRRVSVDFKYDSAQPSNGVLFRFTIELGEQTEDEEQGQASSLVFELASHGRYRLLDVAPLGRLLDPVGAVDGADEASNADQNLERAEALVAIPSVTDFSFVGGLPTLATTNDAARVQYLLSNERSLTNQGLQHWYEEWADLCRELNGELLTVLGSVRHLGPIRKPPERIMLGTSIGGDPSDVGPTGEFILRVLIPPLTPPGDQNTTPDGERASTTRRLVIDETNKWLEDNVYGYQVGIGHGGDRATGPIHWLKLKDLRLNVDVSPKDVGAGISQSLPIIVQLIAAQQQKLITMIEQHEIHIHPRLVVKVTQLMIDTANAGSQVICETHSPEAFLRVANRVGRRLIPLANVSVLCTEVRVTPGIDPPLSSSEFQLVPLNQYGGLDDDWPDPDGFFRERMDETRVR